MSQVKGSIPVKKFNLYFYYMIFKLKFSQKKKLHESENALLK